MVYINEEIIDTICDYFKMNSFEREWFIEKIRSDQVRIFWQAFFVYIEIHKGKKEMDYMEELTRDLDSNPEKQARFNRILKAEFDNNPDLMHFITKKNCISYNYNNL